ncbi:MAG: hypothetical protein VXW65_07500 [Pseudomonadota bacterium]|nr:hypothetical protein [Pseudomonadota bacterium]
MPQLSLSLLFCGLCSLLMSQTSAAFSALVSPPRIEDQARSGRVYRNIIEIQNVADQATTYQIKTNDWSLDAAGGVVFSDALAADSCRPWVGIESNQITLGAQARYRYRFEVDVPENTPAQQCRFALMIEGEPQQVKGSPAPIAGRIGVIIYLNINGAQAELMVQSASTQTQDQHLVPMLQVHNQGNAHGRLEGSLTATDADGRTVQLAPSADPILPQKTRAIALYPVMPPHAPEDAAAPQLRAPLQLDGTLEWQGKPIPVRLSTTP